MLLDELISLLPGAQYDAAGLRRAGCPLLRGVTVDSKRSGPGTVFFSLPERQRVNPFEACAAHERGAPVVIRNRAGNGPAPRGALCIEVDDVCGALGRVAAALHAHPSRRMPVIGIGGRAAARARLAGVLTGLLNALGESCLRVSPDVLVCGDRTVPWDVTEADASRVQEELARHADRNGRACVVELGSGALGVQQLGGVEFRRITDAGEEAGGLRVTRLSVHGSQCEWDVAGRVHRVMTPLVGRSHVAALARALDILVDLGFSPVRLAALLPGLTGSPGWIEPVRCSQPFGVLVDGACDAESMTSLLAEVRELVRGRLTVLTGPRPELGVEGSEALARAAGAGADAVVVTTDNLAPDPFLRASAGFARASAAAGAETEILLDRRRAMGCALRRATSGDAVVLAGKGRVPLQVCGGVRVPWDDRACARGELASMGYVGGDL